MSYILDALRKADAERDRGNVPGIHAQPSFGGGTPSNAQPAAKPWLWLAGGAGAVGIVGALAWYLMAPPHGAMDVAAAPAATPAAPAPPSAPPATTSTQVVPAPAPATVSKLEVAPPVARKPKAAPPAASAAPLAEAKPAATAEKVYTLAELPDDIRRQLPNVTIGGSMYSSKPADRILIINGQVLHEGESIAPDLTLQQIRLKAALLNFKGYRYTIGF